MIDPSWLTDLSVYQDLVLDGRTVLPGRRDSEARWRLLEPHLPLGGAVLDVGSNFGWFGLKLCAARPDVVVASVEADLRSARIQREVLRSHAEHRVCLLTRRADARLIRSFAQGGQRFEAALCLSVLHWLADHRTFLRGLGEISNRILVEHPDPEEQGAGIDSVRREIGRINDYLRSCFPNRPVVRLGETANHREPDRPRSLWLVGAAQGATPAPVLELASLLHGQISWPPRNWWMQQCDRLATPRQRGCAPTQAAETTEGDAPPRLVVGPGGLQPWPREAIVPERVHRRLRRQLYQIPEDAVASPSQRRLRVAHACVRRLDRWFPRFFSPIQPRLSPP